MKPVATLLLIALSNAAAVGAACVSPFVELRSGFVVRAVDTAPSGVAVHVCLETSCREGERFRYDSADGLHWSRSASLLPPSVARVLRPAGAVFGIGTAGEVFRSTDDGTTFSRTGSLPRAGFVEAAVVSGDGFVAVSGGGDGVFRVHRSTDGTTFAEVASFSGGVHAFAVTDGADRVHVVNGWKSFRSTDGGRTFEPVVVRNGGWMTGAGFAAGGVVGVFLEGKIAWAGDGGDFRTLASSGSNYSAAAFRATSTGTFGLIDHVGWSEVTIGGDLTVSFRELDPESGWWSSRLDERLAVLAGSLVLAFDGLLLARGEEGAWRSTVADPAAANDLALEDGRIFAAMPGGTVLVGEELAAMAPKETGTEEELVAVAADGERVRAVGARGGIVGSDDGGETWSLRRAPTGSELFDVVGGEGRFVAVGWGGELLREGADGWRAIPTGTNVRLTRVFHSPGAHPPFLALGPDGTLLGSADTGEWTEIPTPPAVSVVNVAPFAEGWFVASRTTLYRLDDAATLSAIAPLPRSDVFELFHDGTALLFADSYRMLASADGISWSRFGGGWLRGFAVSPERQLAIGRSSLFERDCSAPASPAALHLRTPTGGEAVGSRVPIAAEISNALLGCDANRLLVSVDGGNPAVLCRDGGDVTVGPGAHRLDVTLSGPDDAVLASASVDVVSDGAPPIAWRPARTPPFDAASSLLAADGRLFAVVGPSGWGGATELLASDDDGTSFRAVAAGVPWSLLRDTGFVGFGAWDRIVRSADGVTFDVVGPEPGWKFWPAGLATDGRVTLATYYRTWEFGGDAGFVLRSVDGGPFEEVFSTNASTIRAPMHAGGRFVFVAGGTTWESADGAEWRVLTGSLPEAPAAPGAESTVGVVWTGRVLAAPHGTSTNGREWTPLGIGSGLGSIALDGERLVGVGPGGVVAVGDLDGRNWRVESCGRGGDLGLVRRLGDRLVAAGRGGTILVSPAGRQRHAADPTGIPAD